MRKTIPFSLITFLVSACMLLLSEVVLRSAGFQSWAYVDNTHGKLIYEPDPVLGWRNKAGSYAIPPLSPSGTGTQMEFYPGGRRATRRAGSQSEGGSRSPREVLIVGGSSIQGWAASDHETYAWKLQERFPSFLFQNFGTGAYGTHRSLLLVETELPRQQSPQLVRNG